MGLIGGMARTAVVAGMATAVSNRVSRRQAGRWAAQDQPAYEPNRNPTSSRAATASTRHRTHLSQPDHDLDQLQKLGEAEGRRVCSPRRSSRREKAKILGR